jgi:hypothetical protein
MTLRSSFLLPKFSRERSVVWYDIEKSRFSCCWRCCRAERFFFFFPPHLISLFLWVSEAPRTMPEAVISGLQRRVMMRWRGWVHRLQVHGNHELKHPDLKCIRDVMWWGRQGASSSHLKNLYYHLQIQNDAVNLSPEGRSALQNALLMSAKKFSNGPPQVCNLLLLLLWWVWKLGLSSLADLIRLMFWI